MIDGQSLRSCLSICSTRTRTSDAPKDEIGPSRWVSGIILRSPVDRPKFGLSLPVEMFEPTELSVSSYWLLLLGPAGMGRPGWVTDSLLADFLSQGCRRMDWRVARWSVSTLRQFWIRSWHSALTRYRNLKFTYLERTVDVVLSNPIFMVCPVHKGTLGTKDE